jgi:hypothetical protein
MDKKFKVKITKYAIISIDQTYFDLLQEACFKEGDRQLLNETVDLDYYGHLTIEKVEEE